MSKRKQDRPVRWLIVKIVVVLCALSWAGLAAAAVMGIEGTLWTLVVVAAALTGEGLCWAFAWALGVTLFEARKTLLARAAAKLKSFAGGRSRH